MRNAGAIEGHVCPPRLFLYVVYNADIHVAGHAEPDVFFLQPSRKCSPWPTRPTLDRVHASYAPRCNPQLRVPGACCCAHFLCCLLLHEGSGPAPRCRRAAAPSAAPSAATRRASFLPICPCAARSAPPDVMAPHAAGLSGLAEQPESGKIAARQRCRPRRGSWALPSHRHTALPRSRRSFGVPPRDAHLRRWIAALRCAGIAERVPGACLRAAGGVPGHALPAVCRLIEVHWPSAQPRDALQGSLEPT